MSRLLAPGPTSVRYRILLLTFVVAFVMYIDRACMGAVQPHIMREFGMDKIQMGWASSLFNFAYAAFQVPSGWMTDRYGPRAILCIAIAWWSIFTAATGLTYSFVSLAVTRFLFGIGEAAAFPAASRAILPWLPARQRAFGQGFQHSGSRFGAAVAPVIAAALATSFGWRHVFFLFGALGLGLALYWMWYFRDHPQDHRGVNAAEHELLATAVLPRRNKNQHVPWGRILRHRDLWFLTAMYFCYGWVLWLYMTWLPTYFVEFRKFPEMKMGFAVSLPLLAATITNIVGGTMSDRLAHMWGNLRRGRIAVSVLGFLIAGLGLIGVSLVSSAAGALACLTFALAGLELTVAVSWAMALEMGGDFGGSVSAVMNTGGNLGGALATVGIGYIATLSSWTAAFTASSVLCLLAAVLASRVDPRRSIAANAST